MKIKLTNDFHNTEITINLRKGGYLSIGQVKKIKNTLCGINGCTCGNCVGQRGKQLYDVMEVAPKLYTVNHSK